MNAQTLETEPTRPEDIPDPNAATSLHSRWKRRAACCVIACYLGILAHGVVCHALQFRVNAHPLMYFTVWDMFCGWAGWSYRTHVVAEGQSGQLYELTPTPWGDFQPFSDLGREHYDSFHTHAWRIGVNCLKQTSHEPIQKMYLIEETWSKRYNVPEFLWSCLHDDPPQPNHYFHVDAVYEPCGRLIQVNPTFHDQHRTAWLRGSLRGQSEVRQRQMAAVPLAN